MSRYTMYRCVTFFTCVNSDLLHTLKNVLILYYIPLEHTPQNVASSTVLVYNIKTYYYIVLAPWSPFQEAAPPLPFN